MRKLAAVGYLLVGVSLMGGAAYAALHEPAPQVLTCERTTTAPSTLRCEPGGVNGDAAQVRKRTSKSAFDCFVLGETSICGGDSRGAVAKVNALEPGQKATIDLTGTKAPVATVAFAALFGLVMAVLGIANLRKATGRPSTPRP